MILVDPAVWPWRGRRWAHLVSDESVAELHSFAAELGLRRLGFQGDHYDVDEATRARALASGAVPIGSRELVRRLRAAGLRRPRSTGPWRWQVAGEWRVDRVVDRAPGSWLVPASASTGPLPQFPGDELAALLRRARSAGPDAVLRLLTRPGELAVVVVADDATAPPVEELVIEVPGRPSDR
jgi:hypothetical protein